MNGQDWNAHRLAGLLVNVAIGGAVGHFFGKPVTGAVLMAGADALANDPDAPPMLRWPSGLLATPGLMTERALNQPPILETTATPDPDGL